MYLVKRKIQRLLALFAFGCLALNYPLLVLFSKASLWRGIPVLYLYLFAIWVLFIMLIALVTERKKMAKTSFPPIFSRKPE